MTKEGDIVLCTVRKIEGTTVFLDIEGGGEGNMVLSEVAPGRIRNLREFVVPNKKVVCKVLRVKEEHIELSLRRVTGGEREMVMKNYKKELTLESMLKPILKDKAKQTIVKIEEKYDVADFLDRARAQPSLIREFVTKEEAEKLEKIFTEKKEKKKEIKQKVIVKSQSSSGVEDIKYVLDTKVGEINYLGSSTFQIIIEDLDFKKGQSKMDNLLKEMQTRAKSRKVEFELK